MAIIPSTLECSLLNKRKSRWEKVEELNRDHFTKQQKPSLSQLALTNAHYLANSKYSLPITRWGREDDKPYLPPPFVDLPPGLSPSELDQFLREQRHDELARKIAVGELEFGDPDIRPPSPPPAYDKMGNRVNTRDVRVRNAMKDEYFRIVENLSKVLIGFAPPADYKPVKKFRRIEIPLDKYPEYNFMGLIIGPRGCNHKRLETESGAQISIRGKGTQKEGKRSDHQTDEEAAMPMHVYVCAENEDAVDKAVNLIEPLLDPFHPLHEEYKRRGLEQLALVNGVTMGTLDNSKCTLCGETGHMAYACPDAGGLMNYGRPQVKCEICGDMGHVTMDCKMAKPGDFKILNTLNGTRYPTSTFHSGGISFQPKSTEPQDYVPPEVTPQSGYYADPSMFNQSWNNVTPEAYQYYYNYYQQYYQQFMNDPNYKQYMNDPKYQQYFAAMQQMSSGGMASAPESGVVLGSSAPPEPQAPAEPPIPEPDEPVAPPPPM